MVKEHVLCVQRKSCNLRVLRTVTRELASVQEEFGGIHCAKFRCCARVQFSLESGKSPVGLVTPPLTRGARAVSRPRQRQMRVECALLSRNAQRHKRMFDLPRKRGQRRVGLNANPEYACGFL